MKVLTVISLLLISRTTLAEKGFLLLSCNSHDIVCLNKATTMFLEETHQGIPKHGIAAIDPLLIPLPEIINDDGITYIYRNLNVTGLKHQDIADFKVNTVARSVMLTVKTDINIVGDIEVIITRTSNKFPGSFISHAGVLVTATYNYELKRDDKGVLHFEIGPETITCKVTSPVDQFSPDLQHSLALDETLKNMSKEKKLDVRAKIFCSVVKESYKVVIHNIRVAARLFPASAFFKDITNITKVQTK